MERALLAVASLHVKRNDAYTNRKVCLSSHFHLGLHVSLLSEGLCEDRVKDDAFRLVSGGGGTPIIKAEDILALHPGPRIFAACRESLNMHES